MIELLFSLLWFFLPVGVANMAPIFAAKIPFLKPFDYPLDRGYTFKKKRVFGSHKTVRGLLSGILLAMIVVFIQTAFYNQFPPLRSLSMINYALINPLLFGLLCGTGAIMGDAIESFFKRQLGVPPGKPWFPFDQIDYILGGIIFTYFYLPLSFTSYFFILVSYFFLHLLSSYLGYLLGLKDEPI